MLFKPPPTLWFLRLVAWIPLAAVSDGRVRGVGRSAESFFPAGAVCPARPGRQPGAKNAGRQRSFPGAGGQGAGCAGAPLTLPAGKTSRPPARPV